MRSARLLALVLLLSVAGSAASSTYTLKRGDTLSRVASKFKVPLAALTAANADTIPNPNKVREGQKVTVPDPKAAQVALAKPIASAASEAPADGSKLYKVAAGDTLGGIAKRFGTTVADLVERNGLKGANAVIREGRELKLPPTADVPHPEVPLCPVRGAGKFDFSNSYGSPREGQRSHAGNDIFAKRGTPVVAGVDGTIKLVSGGRAGLGYYLEGVDGVTYYGAHMNELRVGNGQSVKRGEVLGTVGNTGNAAGTPPHLHFEVKPGGGASIDPYALLRTWCK
jgi:murein DD-endopeptidase MepM/ murein hydrolase activator NlpD